MVDVVVAKHREDVSWLGGLPHRTYVYDKSGTPTAEGYISLENKYREAGTYLHHIIQNFHDLGDFVIFLQGNPFDHTKLPRHEFLNRLGTNPLSLLDDGAWKIHTNNGNGRPDHFMDLPVDGMYMQLTGETSPLPAYRFRAGAQYMVSREKIHSRGIEFYQGLYDSMTDVMAEGMCPWTLERLWPIIFNLG